MTWPSFSQGNKKFTQLTVEFWCEYYAFLLLKIRLNGKYLNHNQSKDVLNNLLKFFLSCKCIFNTQLVRIVKVKVDHIVAHYEINKVNFTAW